MKAAIIIPARYASTRLPGKMLLEGAGKPLIQHTYERARKAKKASQIIIASDDERIVRAAHGFGANAVMTGSSHSSGSARAAEVAGKIDADVIVNLQGDEPEIDPDSIDRLIALQADHGPFCSTLACRFPAGANPNDPSAVKAVLGRQVGEDAYEAVYFTRALAPFPRDGAGEFHLHLGIYAFRRDSLQKFAAAPEGRLEKTEKLEQLRILEMGERILVAIVPSSAPGVDTPEDFAAFKARVEGVPQR